MSMLERSRRNKSLNAIVALQLASQVPAHFPIAPQLLSVHPALIICLFISPIDSFFLAFRRLMFNILLLFRFMQKNLLLLLLMFIGLFWMCGYGCCCLAFFPSLTATDTHRKNFSKTAQNEI